MEQLQVEEEKSILEAKSAALLKFEEGEGMCAQESTQLLPATRLITSTGETAQLLSAGHFNACTDETAQLLSAGRFNTCTDETTQLLSATRFNASTDATAQLPPATHLNVSSDAARDVTASMPMLPPYPVPQAGAVAGPGDISNQQPARDQLNQSSSAVDVLSTLAKLLTEKNNENRLPVLEPELFTGNIEKFPVWIKGFETYVEHRTSCPIERLHFLGRYTDGAAHSAIAGFLHLRTSDAYTKAKEKLVSRYGNDYLLANSYSKRLRDWPVIRGGDNKGLQQLADFLEHCLMASSAIAGMRTLDDPYTVQLVLKKLPYYVSDRWKRVVDSSVFGRSPRYPTFAAFVDFITTEARIACGPVSMQMEVKVFHRHRPERALITYALLDAQSDASFMTDSVCKTLQVSGSEVELELSTMAGTASFSSQLVKDLRIESLADGSVTDLPDMYTRAHIPADRSLIPQPKTCEKWPHLRQLADDIHDEFADAEIGLLLGINCARAIKPREIIPGDNDDPWATVTSQKQEKKKKMTKQEAKEKKMTKEEEKEKKMTKENEERMSKEKTMMKEVNELCASSEGDENLTPVTPQDESHKVTGERSKDKQDAAEAPMSDLPRRMTYFSNWHRAKKSVALCVRYKHVLAAKVNAGRCTTAKVYSQDLRVGKPLTVEELHRGETEILKATQKEAFQDEYALLSTAKNEKKFSKKSRLFRLDPYLDKDGVIRVGGRISRSAMPPEVSHPAILPRHSHVTELLVKHYHEKTGHSGRGSTLNELRAAGYWIVGGRSAVSSHILSCVTCKRLRGRGNRQQPPTNIRVELSRRNAYAPQPQSVTNSQRSSSNPLSRVLHPRRLVRPTTLAAGPVPGEPVLDKVEEGDLNDSGDARAPLKWQHRRPNLRPGDVVSVMDDAEPRPRWPLGRVVNVHPGAYSPIVLHESAHQLATSLVRRHSHPPRQCMH
ncbi:hypothetical protein FJT64_027426 [Amphibalanus amphitrite]|uniref:Integrase zinc-binding domain-containing protein n=1 Tax=Amphibalanus amphitrite TaxID=1232801 RepID=A0A6A4WD21_AMPAM|nr:hypothetical protein FJT64_027426 [Amphibalanus amphitrite]